MPDRAARPAWTLIWFCLCLSWFCFFAKLVKTTSLKIRHQERHFLAMNFSFSIKKKRNYNRCIGDIHESLLILQS